jgi:hypothetical protein
MKRLHIEHPEDQILTGDLSVLDWFKAEGHMSLKIDGCPAIVWGKDPATGTFFVGTKSVFNKKKIKINHSHEEIDQNHEGEVASILHDCFDCLPHIDDIIQCDFIGYGGDDSYTPNALTYVFPEIVRNSIIVAPHTKYEAENDLRDAIASPLYEVFEDTKDVMFVMPDAWERIDEDWDIHTILDFARQMSQMCVFATDSEATRIKKVINTFVKVGAELDPEALAIAAECDVNLMRFWNLIYTIKTHMLSLCCDDGPDTYIGKYYSNYGEGYVRTNNFGTYKLVDRRQFSRFNFLNGKMRRVIR